MDREQLHNLIEEVTGEVEARLARKNGAVPTGKRVLLLAGPPAFPQDLEACLLSRGGGWTTADLSGENAPGRTALQDLVSRAEEVALAAPPIALLKEIAAGEDGSDLAFLMIRSILWGKKTALLLDFDPPRFRRNSLLGQVAEAVEALQAMEVEVVNYRRSRPRTEPLELVTEEAVRRAAKTRERTLRCAMNAIITPSARDAIRELGVEIQY